LTVLSDRPPTFPAQIKAFPQKNLLSSGTIEYSTITIWKQFRFIGVHPWSPALNTSNIWWPFKQKEYPVKGVWRLFVLLLSFFLFFGWSKRGFAQEDRVQEVLTNSLYGGLAGVLVGAVVLAFTNKPGDHLDYLAFGAAGGAPAGATYALVKSPRPMAELDNGKVTIGVPTIVPDIRDTNSRGQTPVVIMAELFRGNF
jgi:hypothetical protein